VAQKKTLKNTQNTIPPVEIRKADLVKEKKGERGLKQTKNSLKKKGYNGGLNYQRGR